MFYCIFSTVKAVSKAVFVNIFDNVLNSNPCPANLVFVSISTGCDQDHRCTCTHEAQAVGQCGAVLLHQEHGHNCGWCDHWRVSLLMLLYLSVVCFSCNWVICFKRLVWFLHTQLVPKMSFYMCHVYFRKWWCSVILWFLHTQRLNFRHFTSNFILIFSHTWFNSKGGESKSSEPVTSTPSGSGSASAYVMPSADNTRIRSIKVNSSGTMVALLTGEFTYLLLFVFFISNYF